MCVCVCVCRCVCVGVSVCLCFAVVIYFLTPTAAVCVSTCLTMYGKRCVAVLSTHNHSNTYAVSV